MKTPTFRECMAALQGVAGAESAVRTLIAGTRWEDDPRVLRFWAQAEELVAVLREAHREARVEPQS